MCPDSVLTCGMYGRPLYENPRYVTSKVCCTCLPRALAMDEKQNYERFDLDNDYEGGEWVGDEYFYRNKKQKHQQTAEDRLYGVFADSDSEGEGRGRKSSRKAADFSRPVGFVSSGVTRDTTQKPEDIVKSEHQSMPAAAAGLGLGAGGGLGFSPQQPAADEDMPEEQEGLLPTAFGQR